jgi:pimeloyl-ACP methyl ester carboxylesterase
MSTANTLAEKQVAEPRGRAANQREGSHAGIATIAAVFQFVMFAAHWFVYQTWTFFWGPTSTAVQRGLAVSAAILSFSFLTLTLVAFRANNMFVRVVYRAAAVWLGALNFLVLAAVAIQAAEPGTEARFELMRSIFPRLQLNSWEGAGHFLMLEDSQRFNAEVEQFLAARS